MTLNNNVIPFQLGNNSVRGNIVRLQTVVSEIVKRHEYPTNVEVYLLIHLLLPHV